MTFRRLSAVAAAGLFLAGCEISPFHFPGGERTPAAAPAAWTGEDVDEDQLRRDVRACYRFAEGQIQRDQTIDQDIGRRDGLGDQTRATSDLLRRMDGYGYEQRRDALISRCMQDKGYARDAR